MPERSSPKLPRVRLTGRTVPVLTLREGASDTIVFDQDIPGFGFRMRESGVRGFLFQYKAAGRTRRMSLGAFPAVTPEAARKVASELHARVRLGGDPAAERDETRARSGETFGALATTYLPMKAKQVRPRTFYEIERALLVLAKPLHSLNIAQVDRRAIAARLTAVTKNSGAVTANRMRAVLSAFFAWGIGQGFIESNPVTGTGKNPEQPRERVLSIDELAAVWRACDRDSGDIGPILRLLMLTAARGREIAELRWSEVADDFIIIPGERTKTARPLVIPVTAPMQQILNAQTTRDTRVFVFGRRGGAAFTGWGPGRARINARIAVTSAALAHWTPHDIRRSVATGLADLGQPPHIIELILNHAGHRSGVAGIYNRSQYQREKLAALTLWGDHLLAAVEGRPAVVVPFTGAVS
jgi:integrase